MNNKDRLDWFLRGLTISNMNIEAVPGGFSIRLDVENMKMNTESEYPEMDERRI